MEPAIWRAHSTLPMSFAARSRRFSREQPHDLETRGARRKSSVCVDRGNRDKGNNKTTTPRILKAIALLMVRQGPASRKHI